MVLKGNQRGGGRQLANHLLNAFDNERVEVAEVRGAVARDLHGAIAEWSAQAKATRANKIFYSLSVNPDHSQGAFTREQYLEFLARAEKRIGLQKQPRAVVFHVKEGREHCHAVWSRTDATAGRAVQIAHDRLKLRSVAREFAREYGLTLPEEKRKQSQKDRFNRPAQNHAEKQQQERTGVKPEDRQKLIRVAWDQSQSAEAFIQALDAHGYHIARGDQRDYVVVDMYGEVHSLSRQLRGVKTKDYNARLASVKRDTLRSVKDAQDHARGRRDAWLEEQHQQQEETRRREQNEKRRADLDRPHEERRQKLAAERQLVEERHTREQDSLRLMQAAEGNAILTARAQKEPRGLRGFLTRITGIRLLTEIRQRRQDQDRVAAQKQQNDALTRRHDAERSECDRRRRDLDALLTRERQSLEIALRREEYQRLALRQREAEKPTPARDTAPPTVQADFRRAAQGDVNRQQQEGGPAPQQNKRDIRPDFARAAQPDTPERQGDGGGPQPDRKEAATEFNDAVKASGKNHPPSDKAPLPETFDQASNPDRAAPPASEGIDPDVSETLASTFNRRAERQEPDPSRDGPSRRRDREGPDGWER